MNSPSNRAGNKDNKKLTVLIPVAMGITIIIMWLVLHWAGSKLISDIYLGQSASLFNSLIRGQQQHPLSEYLSVFHQWNNRIAATLLVSACLIPIIPKLGIHQRSLMPFNLVVLLLMVAIIVWRDPDLFLEPRFWAEEATVFFKTSYTQPLWDSLIAPHQGYYMLWANLAGLLATIPPIKYAPLVTTLMSFVVLFVILLMIMVNESKWLYSSLQKAIASVAVLVVGATGAIWLTSINSQYYMTLVSFLALIDSKHNPVKRRIAYVIVAIAGMSSVAANFLTPLFLARFLHRKERADLLLFFILTITSVVQLTAIGYSIFVLGDSAYYHSSQVRFPSEIDYVSVIQRIIYYSVNYPFFGYSGWLGWMGTALLFILLVTTKHQWRDRWEFPASILLVTCLSVIASLEMQGGPRYSYPVSVFMALMLISYVFDERISNVARIIAGTLLSASIMYWAWHFRTDMKDFRNPDWPSWASEVKAWEQDPGRKLQAHPIWKEQTSIGLIWAVELTPKNPVNGRPRKTPIHNQPSPEHGGKLIDDQMPRQESK